MSTPKEERFVVTRYKSYVICILSAVIAFVPVRQMGNNQLNEGQITQSRGKVKGVYFTAPQFEKRGAEQIISALKENGFNALVINVKNASGKLTYPSKNETAKQMGAITTWLNPKELVKKLHKAGIYIIARQVIFKDPKLADQLGYSGAWVDPASEKAITYNLKISEEVSDLGFDELQLDYARYDDGGKIGKNYRKRSLAITEFVKRTRKNLPDSINLSVDVYGRTLWKWNGKNKDPVGQNLNLLKPWVDYVTPMLYPSHYSQPKYINDPYRCVSESLEAGLKRLDDVRPFIQGFNRSVPADMTTSEYIEAQIKAVRESNLESFLVWNPQSRYGPLWKAVESKNPFKG